MLLVTCALVAPAAAHAQSTGGTSAPEPDPGLIATEHPTVGSITVFRGTLPEDAGRIVTIERLDEETQTWIALATATINPDGTYLARWKADVAGRIATRATVTSPAETGAALALAAPLEASLTVFRTATASWYGPGFYGRKTACGLRMTRKLLGVAHKKLPCGTPVAIAYEGKSITVPVVDRGPFVRGRKWDLTIAAAKAIGFTFTDRVGAVRVD
jgi:rare lipoprotein A (peptidoglycan hydrolase)